MFAAGSGVTGAECAEHLCLPDPLSRVMMRFGAGSGGKRAGAYVSVISLDSLILSACNDEFWSR